MVFPIKLLEPFEGIEQDFHNQFPEDRRDHSLIWIRSQDEVIKNRCGWESEEDQRSRCLHVKYKYGLSDKREFQMEKAFVKVEYFLPHEEADYQEQRVIHSFKENGWTGQEVLKKQGMNLEINHEPGHNYSDLEIILRSGNYDLDQGDIDYYHDRMGAGFRKNKPRGDPEVFEDISDFDIMDYLPAHMETGCGPSIEAGVPALDKLHWTYYLKDKNLNFIFGGDKDNLWQDIANNTEGFFKQASIVYTKALEAKETEFYSLLKDLKKKQLLIEPVITNNYDGILRKFGIQENYVGGFLYHNSPTIDFSEEAKSLIVVGSHADRRKVREQAQEIGLPIIHVNPEGYFKENGEFLPRPIEGVEGDYTLLKMTAEDFAEQMTNKLDFELRF